MSETTVFVPGSVKCPPLVREHRTSAYRTWHSPHRDMAYCAECLLCGQWDSGYTARPGAQFWAEAVHAFYCHVARGCHCPQPHLTAAMAARIGVKGSYPQSAARELFRMAGGTRRYLPPQADRGGTLFGQLPDELGNIRVCLGHGASS